MLDDVAKPKVMYLAEGNVATITLNRPDVLNALDRAGYEQLRAAIMRFDADPDLRVAVVTGAGDRSFCAGADLGSEAPDSDAAPMAVTEDHEEPAPTKPVIAAIDGFCVGGGLEIALRCDIRIATDRSSFGLPEPRWGKLSGYGLHMLSRMLPAGEALYLQLTGDRITAERALRCCLVQELLAPEDLMTRAHEIADMIARCSPLVVQAIKQTVDFGLRRGVEDSYRFTRPLAAEISRSEDAREGSRAFREKRPPEWTGR